MATQEESVAEPHVMTIDNSDEEEEDGAGLRQKKRGHTANTIWKCLTGDIEPRKFKSAVCKHCYTLVNHHKKSESANVHLHRCIAFRKLMNGKVNECPIGTHRI